MIMDYSEVHGGVAYLIRLRGEAQSKEIIVRKVEHVECAL